MKVHGVSLHYFDPDAGINGSDKFYRAFIWQSRNTAGGTYWNAAYHWGRDGAPTGQTKTETYFDRTNAEVAINKKINEKIRKGYEFLGQGEVTITGELSDVSRVGSLLHVAVGRTPTKLGGGFTVVIQEEADLLELLTR